MAATRFDLVVLGEPLLEFNDCLDGAFAARIIAGDTPVEAARYANVAAALATTGYGAVAPLPHHADVTVFLAIER